MSQKITTISGGNGNYPSASGIAFSGGSRSFALQGTFSGTINISASYDDGTTFITLTDSAESNLDITSNSIINVDAGVGIKIRFDVTGASGSNNVDVYVA